MIRYAAERDYENIKKLFNDCFPEDIAFNNYFFNNIYSHKYTLVYEENNKIISMLQSIPYYINNIGNATYIYGACTQKNSRGKGLMAQLLQKSFDEDFKNNISASILIPQGNALFDFYKRFGYETAFFLESKAISITAAKSNLYLKKAALDDINILSDIYRTALKGVSYINRSFEYWKNQILLFNALEGNVFIISEKNKPLGYAFCWNAPIPAIQEIFIIKDSYIQNAINLIAEFYKKDKVKASLLSNSVPFGCIKYHKKPAIAPKKTYMNLMYN